MGFVYQHSSGDPVLFIVCVCGQRGSVEIGGEYLILPAAVIFKKQIISAVSVIDELIWGEG